MRKLLLGSCALLLSGAIAWGANIQMVPPGYVAEPSQIIWLMNSLIQQMNQNVSGVVASQPGSFSSVGTTAAQTLATTPITSGTLNAPGQSLRMKCHGSVSGTAGTKWVALTFGTTVVTQRITTALAPWSLDLLVTAVTPTANYVAYGSATVSGTLAGAISRNVTADNLSTSLTASCTSEQALSGANEVQMYDLLIEQVK